MNQKPFLIISLISLFLASCSLKHTNERESIKKEKLLFFVISDLGRNGYDYQRQVAETMGRMADSLSPSFIISSGDQFHVNGVRGVQDPIWLTNYENVYSHPALHVDWYPVLGNHEYHGNTDAVIDYSKISRRWCMPSRYYTMVKKVNDSIKLRLIFIDTSPLIHMYRENPAKYPDAVKQDSRKQWAWIDSVLSHSAEKWKLVVGHHPVYSIDGKHGNTHELILQLKPLLEKYKADFYFAGHIHNFQHLCIPDSDVDYIVTSSASKSRPDSSSVLTRFSSPLPGFSVCSVAADTFRLYFIDQNGKIIYSYNKVKNN